MVLVRLELKDYFADSIIVSMALALDASSMTSSLDGIIFGSKFSDSGSWPPKLASKLSKELLISMR